MAIQVFSGIFQIVRENILLGLTLYDIKCKTCTTNGVWGYKLYSVRSATQHHSAGRGCGLQIIRCKKARQ